MSGNVARPGTSVAGRLLDVLGSFDTTHPSLRLTDIARRADLPLPTTHRLLAELTAWGAVSRQPDGSFVIGRRLWDLGMLAPAATGLREAAAPFLHDIHAATRATVHLAVRDGTYALYLDRVAGSSSVPVVSRVGSRLPLYATGVGKVLLAYAPPDVQAEVYGHLERITPYTITQPGRLRSQLARVGSDGFAQTQEEMSLGACSVAVPVMDCQQPDRAGRGNLDHAAQADHVVAALGIVVANLKQDRARLVAALQVAASGISRSLPSAGFH